MAEQSGHYELAVAKAQMRSAEARQAGPDSLGDQMRANRTELTGRMLGAALGIALLAVFVFAGSQWAWLVNSIAGALAVGLTVSIAARRSRMTRVRKAQFEATMRERAEKDDPSGAVRAGREATDM